MATSWPGAFDSVIDLTLYSREVDHVDRHNTAQDGIQAMQASLGLPASSTVSGATTEVRINTVQGAVVAEAATARAAEALALPRAGGTVTGDIFFESGRPWFDVVAFGADPTGTNDSTASIQAAINASTGAANPVTTARVCKGTVYLPAGTYKITSDLMITSVMGFHLKGDAADSTTIRASGTGFANAMINIDGSEQSIFEKFTLRGDGTEQLPNGLILQWDNTKAARSTSANTFANIWVRNLKYVNGFNIGFNTVSTPQVDGTTFRDIVIAGSQSHSTWSQTGNWQVGMVIGNGNFGNNYDHVLYNVSCSGNYLGIQCLASGYAIYGGQPGNNFTDFYMSSSGTQITVASIQSQNSAQFISAGGVSPVTGAVRDCLFNSSFVLGSGQWFQVFSGANGWVVENVLAEVSNVTPVMFFSNAGGPPGGKGENVILIKVSQSAPPTTGIVSAGGGPIIAIGYTQLDNAQHPTVLFPFWTTGSNFLFSKGLAAAQPAASTNGEGFYLSTDTQAFAHSDGSTWTNLPSPQVPNVQLFNATGTWTKPANAQAVQVIMAAGGSGGGSGRRGAAGSIRAGGAGGGGGALITRNFVASDLPGTLTVTIGAGGAGGAAITVDSTNGNPGQAGTQSSLALSGVAYLTCSNGGVGAGGTAAGATGGFASGGMIPGQAGASASATGLAGVGVAGAAGNVGGSAGGGITAGDVAGNGAGGQFSYFAGGNSTLLGQAGTVDTTPPTSGTALAVQGSPGVSAGSGAASITTAAQQGANALANSGAGGSGGGASLNGNNSGAGGNGGSGFALIVTYFQ